MGAGARAVLHEFMGFAFHAAAGFARSGGVRTEGWAADGEVWEGDVHLYGICVLPAAAGGGAGSGAVVCEFAGGGALTRVVGHWSLALGRRARGAVRGRESPGGRAKP